MTAHLGAEAQSEPTTGRVREVKLPGNGSRKLGKCIDAALRKARMPATGTCEAVLLLGNPEVREVFMAHHADLLDAAFWQGHKERIQAGYVHDVFPYERDKRFLRWQAPNASTEQTSGENHV